MPTQLQNVRRSSRNAGKKIKTPKYAHDLFEDPPKVSGKKKHGKVSKKTGRNRKLTVLITSILKLNYDNIM